MSTHLEVLFTPADFAAFAARDHAQTVCVVFDVLRATSTMVTALAHGAEAIVPVAEIAEALAVKARQPAVLLAGERQGVRIGGELTGGIEFDLGNSPREFLPELVRDRTIVMSTTNGTRALRACAGAREVLVGSFLNLSAVAARLRATVPARLVIVCSGTFEEASLEDTLGAGALCDLVWDLYEPGHVVDSARMALELHRSMPGTTPDRFGAAHNGRRLLRRPELRDDLAFCAQRDVFHLVPVMGTDGAVRRMSD